MRWPVCVVVSGMASTAMAQMPPTNGRLVFEFDRTIVTPQNPSVTLTVSAAWEQATYGDFGFNVANYDLVADSGVFTNAVLLLGLNPPNNPGTVTGNRIEDAAIAQFAILHSILKLDNPIVLAEYTWETSNFTRRSVAFHSEDTTNFAVVPTNLAGAPLGPPVHLFPGQFTPGFGSIQVVPAPAGAVLLLALTPRRRRSARAW